MSVSISDAHNKLSQLTLYMHKIQIELIDAEFIFHVCLCYGIFRVKSSQPACKSNPLGTRERSVSCASHRRVLGLNVLGPALKLVVAVSLYADQDKWHAFSCPQALVIYITSAAHDICMYGCLQHRSHLCGLVWCSRHAIVQMQLKRDLFYSLLAVWLWDVCKWKCVMSAQLGIWWPTVCKTIIEQTIILSLVAVTAVSNCLGDTCQFLIGHECWAAAHSYGFQKHHTSRNGARRVCFISQHLVQWKSTHMCVYTTVCSMP